MFTNLRRRMALTMPIAAMLVAMVAPQPAAAGEPLVFDVTLGGYCLAGTGPASTQLTVRLRSANGTLQGKFTETTDASGQFSSCEFWWPIDPGDTISAEGAGVSRTYTVPNLKLNVNRVTDVVSGSGQANSNVVINVFDCQDFECSFAANANLNTTAGGSFAHDFTAQYNVRGNDLIDVRWTSPTNDEVHASRVVSNMTVTVGTPEVFGRAKPATSTTVELRNASGSLRGKFTDLSSTYSGSFSGQLRNNSGTTVNPNVGDKVISSFASDARITVINSSLSGDAGTNVITGKCFPNRPFTVYAADPIYERTPGDSEYVGVTNASGNFSVNINNQGDTPGFDLMAGDILYVECRTKKGDTLETFDEV